MGRKQKIALTFFIICIFILLIIVGGYMFVKTRYPLKYEDYIIKLSLIHIFGSRAGCPDGKKSAAPEDSRCAG